MGKTGKSLPKAWMVQHHLRWPVHRPVQHPVRHTGPKVRAVVPLLHLPLAGQVRAL